MRLRLLLGAVCLTLVAGKRDKRPPPTFLDDGPIVSANPLYPVTAGDRRLHALVYDRLFVPNPTGGGWVGPVLEAWSAEPDGRLRLRVRKDVAWHDGQPVSADDICATLGALADEATTAPIARLARRHPATCGVDPDDPRIAWVTLPEREPEPWRHLAVPLLPAHIVSGAVAVGDLAEPVGTGPYRATFDGHGWRFEDAGAPHRPAPVPVLQRAWTPLAAARLGALRAGGAQALVEVAPQHLLELRGEDEYTLRFVPRQRWTGILVDTTAVTAAHRAAIDLALDRAALREEVAGVDPQRDEQPVTLLSGPGPHDAPSYNRGIAVPTPDPDAARAALGEEPPTLRLGVAPGLDHGPGLADAVQRQLLTVGLTIEVVPFEPAEWFDAVLSGERADAMDLLLVTFDTTHDPDAWLHSRRDGRGVLQPFGAGHPQVDRALDAVRQATDRVAARRELHAVLADTRALLPLWQTDAWTAWRSEWFDHQPITAGDYFGQVERWTPRPKR